MGLTWYLYVIRTVGGSLYAGIATDVRRRYQEHAGGEPSGGSFQSPVTRGGHPLTAKP